MDRERAGAALRQLRILLGLSQQEVALALGVTQGALSQWELGRTELRISDVQRLAQIFEIPLATLLRELGYQIDAEVITIGQWLDQHRDRIRVRADRPANAVQQNPAKPFGRTLRRGLVLPTSTQDDGSKTV